MFPQVTLSAQELEVIEAQCDFRIRNVEWCQLLNVMHDDARLIDPTSKTVLAQMMFALCIFIPAILPCLRTVEAPCEFLCHSYHQHKRTSRARPSVVNPEYIVLERSNEKHSLTRTGVEPVPSLRIIMRTDSSPLVVTWSPVVCQPLTLSLYK